MNFLDLNALTSADPQQKGNEMQQSPPPQTSIRESSAAQPKRIDGSSAQGFTVYVEPEQFLSTVENELIANPRRGTLAYLEIIDHAHDDEEEVDDRNLAQTDQPISLPILQEITTILGNDGICSWLGGRYIILLYRPATLAVRQLLSKISYAVALQDQSSLRSTPHLTPAVGYVDFRLANSPRELWAASEEALDHAKQSLEIEPYRFRRPKKDIFRLQKLSTRFKPWEMAPQWFVLFMQLMLSLAIALGAPFLIYAICDALGFDITGPVYIGVVIVLVVTATTIWIEGLLALKATTPPLEPGSAYPLATIIIPAYLPNEAATIMETLQAFLKIQYANTVQIILAYNSPFAHLPVEDEIHALVAAQSENGRFLIEPIRVEGSTSKAQNVNAAIGRVRGRFVGIYDADHHPRPDSLERAWRWLSNGWDIVQGRCSVRNGGDNWVSRMVAVEFEQIYAVSHPGRARLHGFGIFGGSNGFWRTSVLHETRMRRSMLTEDIDSSIRALTAGYKIAGDRDLISEELAPTSVSQLLNQRLRWAQGWFQVSFRRIIPAVMSRNVTIQQKLGLIHLLVWRELFPWYSVQVVPILFYWIWVYGWSYIHWAIPIFVATTIYTISTGPGQIIIAYILAEKNIKKRRPWFIQYFFVSFVLYSPFKDALSRVAHVKEGLRERTWKVTPRAAPVAPVAQSVMANSPGLTRIASVLMTLTLLSAGKVWAQPAGTHSADQSTGSYIATLLGGEAETIQLARRAAAEGRHAEAANLFAKAIADVPRRRAELLPEYSDNLRFAGRNNEAVPLYREMLANTTDQSARKRLSVALARSLTDSGQNAAALAIYNMLLTSYRMEPMLVVGRASVLSRLGQSDQALAALDTVPPRDWANGQTGMLADQILIAAAESSANAGRRGYAKALYERAFQHNARLRAIHQPSYIALSKTMRKPVAPVQATPAEQIDLDRRELARSVAGSAQYRKLQSQLARGLTNANEPEKALVAWDTYLRYEPNDFSAQNARADLFVRLNQHEQAFAIYKALYAENPLNVSVRTDYTRELVFLARVAAREDRNRDAVALFAAATTVNNKHDTEIMREYADQLTFTGRATDAIPVYEKVINDPDLSELDRQRARIGLADAYSWANQLADALPIYTELSAAAPGNVDLQWAKLVCGARIAARADRNTESARLFEQAVALDPNRRLSILPEYADQLSFTGQNSQAVAFYKEALAQHELTPIKMLSLRAGLAQTYALASRYTESEAEYQSLLKEHPGRNDFQLKLWIVSAREAAVHNRNQQSAMLFAKAIQADPEHGKSLLREYADQLSFTGRAAFAPAFYKAALKQPSINAKDQFAITMAQAQALEWSGQYIPAGAIYDGLLKTAPGDVTLQWHRLVLSARDAANSDQNAQSAKDFAAAIKLLPARRLEILKDYADQLTFSDQAAAAIPIYRELMLTISTPIEHQANELALARAFAWDHQLKEALNVYNRLIASDPADLAAQIGAARTLSWMGRQGDARSAFLKILAANPSSGDALRGLAQVEDWDGRHFKAQALLRQRLAKDPNDFAAQQLLAQSLVWSGRPDIATKLIKTALKNRPAKHLETEKINLVVDSSATNVQDQ